jgi:RNA polymerase-binding transcription factor DksA
MREAKQNRSSRDRALRRVLGSERDRILNAIRLAIRMGREQGAIEDAEVQDRAEVSEADAQGEIEFALLQMHGDTLQQIEDALDRLDTGTYGTCVDCGGGILAHRLEVLPFATRCLNCEEAHEAQRNQLPPPAATWRKTAELFG